MLRVVVLATLLSSCALLEPYEPVVTEPQEPTTAVAPTEVAPTQADALLDMGANALAVLGGNPLVAMPAVQIGHLLLGAFRRKKPAAA